VKTVPLWFESIGPADGVPMLLVMGLGMQATGWDDAMIAQLVAGGHRVIRFDNRDAGLSPTVEQPYGLDDMAADTIALLDSLGIERVHLVGASMGGMIAQLVALARPDRVRTLTSIMSTTGDRDLPGPSPVAIAAITRPLGATREERIAGGVETMRVLAGAEMPYDEEYARRRVTTMLDRAWNPAGFLRQLQAVMIATPRSERLRALKIPALVIHGAVDPLVPIAHGERTAHVIPGARWLPIAGMGHALPQQALPQIVPAILGHARAANS
jgi:pimeloyl-ACP methyl ester carboxylesterase